MREIFQIKFVEKIKRHILCSIIPPPENHAFYDMKKCCRAGQPTGDNLAHTRCMLDTQGYKYTLGICNAYYFSTATVIVRTRLGVKLHIRSILPVLFFSL